MSISGSIQQYTIQSELRRSDWSQSYLVRTPEGATAVLKLITHPTARQPDWADRFQQRMTAVQKLSQGGPAGRLPIAPIHQWGQLAEPLPTPHAVIPAETPYLVMGYIEGQSLADLLEREHRLSLPEAAIRLAEVAAALDQVHAAGVVHGNLKPGNLLFDKSGRLYLTDFYLLPTGGHLLDLSRKASLEDAYYLSPEQAQSDQAISASSDIYALGLIFFEMVTGQRPFSGNSAAQLIRRHAFDPHPPVSRINPDLPADLELILNQALAKNHLARYQTAGELANAIQQILPEEPIRPDKTAVAPPSAPPTTPLPDFLPDLPAALPPKAPPPDQQAEQTAKAAPPSTTQSARARRRDRQPATMRQRSRSIVLAVALLIALCLCCALVVPFSFGGSAEPAAGEIPRSGPTAVLLSESESELAEMLAGAPNSPSTTLVASGPRPLAEIARFGEGTIRAIAVAPAGDKVAIAGPLGVKLYDTETLAPLPPASESPTTDVVWLENGRFLAWPVHQWDNNHVAIANDSGEPHAELPTGSSSNIKQIAATHDGRQLAILLNNGELQLWDVVARQMSGQWEFSEARPASVAWSPSGDRLAMTTGEQTILLLEPKTGTTALTLEGSPFNLVSAIWSPDGRYLAALNSSGLLVIWETSNGRLLLEQRGVSAIQWSDNGRYLTGGDFSGVLHFWDVKNLLAGDSRSARRWTIQEGPVLGLQWLADPPRLLSWSEDGWVRLHDGESGDLIAERGNFNSATYNAVSDLAWSPDGRFLAASSWDRTLRLWDVDEAAVSQVLRGHNSYISQVDWSPDGLWIASGSLDAGGALRLWSSASGESLRLTYEDDSPVSGLAFSPDGRWLAVGLRSGLLALQPIPPGEGGAARTARPGIGDIESLAWSPDNGRLLIASREGQFALWQMPDGALERRWAAETESYNMRLAWSPSGPTVALAGSWNEVQIWQSDQWELVKAFSISTNISLSEVAFSEDGRWLALVGGVQPVTIVSVTTGEVAYVGDGHGNTVRAVAWSPTAPDQLATGGDDGLIRIWQMPGE